MNRIINVNDEGFPLDGEPIATANPAAVVMGLVEVEKVTFRYPDGQEVEGETTRITKRGMAALRREFEGGADHAEA